MFGLVTVLVGDFAPTGAGKAAALSAKRLSWGCFSAFGLILGAGEVVDAYELKLRRRLLAPIGVISIDSHCMALGARIRDSRES
jgi:hypothetical protein